MIWLTWRQQRFEVLIGAAVLGLMAAILIATGLQMASDYQQTGVGTCLAHATANCFPVVQAFSNRFGDWEGTTGWLNFLPLVFGLLFGAPFVLEMEQGTYRLAWTQSITRTRWVSIKLGVILAVTLLTAGLFTILMTWWRIPFDQLEGRFTSNTGFDFEGTAPLGYAVFAVSLGIALGTLIRKTIPALGLSLAGFLAVRLGIQNFLRPYYFPPLHALVRPVAGGNAGPHRADWVLSNHWSDRFGHQISDLTVFRLCPPSSGSGTKSDVFSCFSAHHIYADTVYQPASRFWMFQGIETGIFLGISALLLGVTVWWIQHRTS